MTEVVITKYVIIIKGHLLDEVLNIVVYFSTFGGEVVSFLLQ